MKIVGTLFCLSVLLVSSNATHAIPEFNWVNKIGGSGDDTAAGAVTDVWNDVIVTGFFENSVVLDTAHSLTAVDGKDIFITKYSPGGTLLWARSIGGAGDDHATAITVDRLRNIYIAGNFTNDLTIDTTTLNQADGNVFFAKLNPDGDPIWVRQAGSPPGASSITTSVASIGLDALGNIYLTGTFVGNVRFAARTLMPTSFGSGNAYVVKYSPDGNRAVWLKHIEGAVDILMQDMAVHTDLFVTGIMTGSVRVDATELPIFPASAVRSVFNFFVLKFSSTTGVVLSGQRAGAGGISSTWASGIATDGRGDAFVAGYFNAFEAEFDPATRISSVGGPNVFLANYDASGAFSWVTGVGTRPNSTRATELAVRDAKAVIVGDFTGTGEFAGTTITATDDVTRSGGSDLLIAEYESTLSPPRSWQWVKTAGGSDNDSATSVTFDGRKDIILSGQIGEGDAKFDSITVTNTGSGTMDSFIAKLSEPVEPLPDDPFDDDPLITGDWELTRWQCYGNELRFPRPCPLVYRTNFFDYPVETIWTMTVDGLNLTSPDDVDNFILTLPDPAHISLGDRYFDIHEDPAFDDEGNRLTTREPLVECQTVPRQVPGPDPRGVRTINVTSYGRLSVKVVPSVARPLGLGGEHVIIADGAEQLSRGAATDAVAAGCPRSPAYDPRTEERPPDRTRVTITVGDREGRRADSAVGSYSLELTYRIHTVTAGPPPWVIDQMEARGLRQLGELRCISGRSPMFPFCAAGNNGFSVIDLIHPNLRDAFDCIADGPGCWDIRQFNWDESNRPFNLRFSADENIAFTLFSESGEEISRATPSNIQQGIDAASAFNTEINLPSLQPGRYFIVSEGKPSAVRLSFSTNQNVQETPSNFGLELTLLFVLLLLIALTFVLRRRS